MATTDSSNDLEAPPGERSTGSRARRELLIFGIAFAGGLILMPFLIWLVGNRVLGPYTHGQELRAGPVKLLGDFFVGLAHGSVIFWCVALGPYLLLMFIRLLYGFVRYPARALADRSTGM
ncbi:MAG: hypothetical protein JWN85_1006 [Gammaproteobacteria bacterium]|nr:hypothetical protein [Gammaproteobacteria bacterium]